MDQPPGLVGEAAADLLCVSAGLPPAVVGQRGGRPVQRPRFLHAEQQPCFLPGLHQEPQPVLEGRLQDQSVPRTCGKLHPGGGASTSAMLSRWSHDPQQTCGRFSSVYVQTSSSRKVFRVNLRVSSQLETETGSDASPPLMASQLSPPGISGQETQRSC